MNLGGGSFLGRPRKPEELKSTTIFVKVPNLILREMIKDGNPREVIMSLIKEKYEKK